MADRGHGSFPVPLWHIRGGEPLNVIVVVSPPKDEVSINYGVAY